ncbi:MAG: DNA polymerase III subunit gamma/tau [Bacteroidota bacterium]
MENFVVSARKYRPATFDSVIGQEHITQTLKNAIKQNQVAHAFLFCGPRGVGKTTCARILAKTINCTNISADSEACNECESCKAFNGNGSFNIYELDAASNNSVEDIRSLSEQVRYAPQGAKYKIYIIDEVHMLSAQAFNAFLKTLEEPPPYAKFILATTERHKILPTILSRCQVFDFHRIKIEDAVKQLKKIITSEGIVAEEEALHEIAQKADGAMRDALSIFDRIVSSTGKNITYKDVINNLNILDYDYYFKAVDRMIQKDLAEMLLLFDEVLSNGFDAQHFLNGFSDHIRNLTVCKYPNTLRLLEATPSVSEKFITQSKLCSNSILLNALNLLNKCELEYKSSKNQRLHVELTLMKLCHIQSVIDLKSEAADIKKKTPEQPVISTSEIVEPAKPKLPEANTIKSVEQNLEIKNIVVKPLPPLIRPTSEISTQSKLEKLKQLVTVGKNENLLAEKTAIIESSEESENNLLTDEQFSTAINNYIEHLNSSGKKSLISIYKNAKFQVSENQIVEMILSSLHEKEMFEDDKVQITPFMRKIFGNQFEFKIIVNQSALPKKAFTAEEKFIVMSNKNPVLLDLRNVLGLEFE